MRRRAAFAWLLALPGCAFPEALTCRSSADCRMQAVCVAGRCAAPDVDSGTDAASDGPGLRPEMSADATTAAPPGFCASLCPEPGRCEALVPLEDGGFEQGHDAWVFEPPSHRANRTVDLRTPAEGRFLGEALVDWTLGDEKNAARFEQRLPVESLPPGDYRLCFQWRVVSGYDNCDSDHAPSVHVNALDEAGEEVVWTRSPAEVCVAIEPVGGNELATTWTEACLDIQRESTWTAPGLAFAAARTGTFATPSAHRIALDVDEVRLAASACVTWR